MEGAHEKKRGLAPAWPALVAVALAIALLVADPWFLDSLRNAVFDAFQRWRPRPPGAFAVRILDIDEESLRRRGQWPWPRTELAAAVDRLSGLGAEVVVFDILLAEPDRTAPARLLSAWSGDPAVDDLVARLPDPDRALAESIAAARVITSFILVGRETASDPPAVKAPVALLGEDPLPFLWGYAGWSRTLPELEAGAVGNGALNYVPGRDGVVRQVPLLLRSGERAFPTMVAEAVRVARGEASHFVKTSEAGGVASRAGIQEVGVGGVVVPTDSRGQIWLHYSLDRQERRIPAWRLLEDEVAAEEVKGAVVIIGTSAAGLGDLRTTPLGTMAGSEVMAQGIEQVQEGSFLRRPAWAKGAELLLLLSSSLVMMTLTRRLGAVPSALLALVAIGGLFVLSWVAFSRYGLLLDPLSPSLGAAAAFVVASVARHRQTERERRWIRDAFSSYISPNLVQHLIDHPDELRLGGERRECTFVLSDLADFTPLVERSEPEVVLAILNEYLDRLINIALEHEGTVDRIVGDAVAVMFSAPVAQADHPSRGVACALAMDRFARRFRQRKQAEGVAIGMTRIGVNTGRVTVGNVGGSSLIDYRALGDAINGAARLESVNRQLGTRVCVAGATVAGCAGFVGRPVGELVLKGKSEPIEAFEPLTGEEAASAAVAAYARAFDLLGRDDARALESFREAVRDHPEDSLAAFHLARLERGETGRTIVFAAK